jgi:hypothetical protein
LGCHYSSTAGVFVHSKTSYGLCFNNRLNLPLHPLIGA